MDLVLCEEEENTNKQKIRTVTRSSYITNYKFVQVPELLEGDEEYLQKLHVGDVLSESDLCYLY